MVRKRNPKSEIRNPKSLVAVIMGSKSDWETMRHTDEVLTSFGVAHECRVISAHRTPELASAFASNAQARGTEVIIAAAGGAAHLAGVIAAHTTLPVLGVPMKSDALNGMDSLLSTELLRLENPEPPMPRYSRWRYWPIVGPNCAKSCVTFVKIRRSRFAKPSSNSRQTLNGNDRV